MSADNHVAAVRRWRRQPPFQVFGARLEFLSQPRRKRSPRFELSLQAGRQTVAFRQTRRQVVVAAIVPVANGIAVVDAEAAAVMAPAAALIIIVIAIVFVVTAAVSLSLEGLGIGQARGQRKYNSGAKLKPSF